MKHAMAEDTVIRVAVRLLAVTVEDHPPSDLLVHHQPVAVRNQQPPAEKLAH